MATYRIRHGKYRIHSKDKEGNDTTKVFKAGDIVENPSAATLSNCPDMFEKIEVVAAPAPAPAQQVQKPQPQAAQVQK